MSAVRELYEKMSLRRSLRYAGISRHMWYHKPKARDIGLDMATVPSSAEDRWQKAHLWYAPHGRPGVLRDTYCHKSQEDTENIPKTRLD